MSQRSDRCSYFFSKNTCLERMMASQVILILLCILGGCGENATTRNGLSKTSIPSSKELPDEYRTLAAHLCIEMKQDPGQFQDQMSLPELMAEYHSILLDLQGIKSKDTEIKYISKQGQEAISEIVRRIDRLEALPKPPESGTLIVDSSLDLIFGNITGTYNRRIEAEAKQNAWIAEVHPLLAALVKLEMARQMLPKVGKKYSATMSNSTGRIAIDFNAAWGESGPHDWLLLQNSGQPLKDCTILVQLNGANGEVRKNVHFLKTWPAGGKMWSQYQQGEEILERKVERSTVANVKDLEITIYSPQFATHIKYAYQGTEKDKDIATICNEMNFNSYYQPYVSSVIWWDTQRGIKMTLHGVSVLPESHIQATFRKGEQSKTCSWETASWANEETKTFSTTAGDLTFDPDKVDIAVTFPYTNFSHRVTLPVNTTPTK